MAKIALLIGVSEYGSGLNPLPAAVKDIEAMRQVLQHPGIGGFEVEVLRNPEPQVMQEAIETLFSGRARDDLALLFFSGHGIKDDIGRLFFATRITRKNHKGELIKATAVSASSVQDVMQHSRCKRQVVILDCCFSGAFAEGMTAKDDGSVDVQTQLGGEGKVVLTSSTSTQYSFEQQGSDLSIYTQYLVEGLETGDADQDCDGLIAIGELHKYAKRKVREVAPAMKPEIYVGREGNEIILSRVLPTDPVLRYRREIERLAYFREITFSRQTLPDQIQSWLNLQPRTDVQMSPVRRKILETSRHNLGLSPEVADQIETEALQPYRQFSKNLESYEQHLMNALRRNYPLKDSTWRELKEYQRSLGIPDENAAPVEQRALQNARRISRLSAQNFQNLINSNVFLLLFGIILFVVPMMLTFYFLGTHRFQQNQIEQSGMPSDNPSPSTNLPETTPSPISNKSFESEISFKDGRKHYENGIQNTKKGKMEAAEINYGYAIERFNNAIRLKEPTQLQDAYLYLFRAAAYDALGDEQNAYKDYQIVEGSADARLALYKNETSKEALVKESIEDYEAALRFYKKYERTIDARRVSERLIVLYENQRMPADSQRVRDSLKLPQP